MGRFDGRVAIVTGGARGIGAGIARRFAEEGASVAILDLDEEQAAATAGDLPVTGGAKAIGVGCNVSDGASVDAAVSRVVDELGGVHILVNNAGITRDNLLFKLSEDDWDSVMNVHLKGAFLMSKAVQKTFVDQKYGKILGLSSVSANGNRGQANYSAAKAGVQGFTRTLGSRARQVRRERQRDRARIHRDRDDRRHGATARARRRGVPEDERRGQPGQARRPPRGHRRGRRVPVQRRGVVHHRTDAVRRRRREDLSSRINPGNGGVPALIAPARFVMLTPMSASPARGSSCRPTRFRPRRRIGLGLSLVLAACGGDKDDDGDKKPQSQPVEGGKTLAARVAADR